MGLEEIDILPGVIVGFLSHPLSDSDVHCIYARTAISAAELNCSSEGTLKVPHSPTNSDLIHWLEMFEKWWERLSNSLFMSTPTKMKKNRIYSQYFGEGTPQPSPGLHYSAPNMRSCGRLTFILI